MQLLQRADSKCEYCIAEEGVQAEVNEDFIRGTGVHLIPYLLEQKHFFY